MPPLELVVAATALQKLRLALKLRGVAAEVDGRLQVAQVAQGVLIQKVGR